MSARTNTDNPVAIVILHFALTLLVLATSLAVLAHAVIIAETPIARTGSLVFGVGFLFGAYKLWQYRARK